MAIVGIDGLTKEQLDLEVQRGGRFVLYMYCVSVIFMTFRRGTDVHFIRSGERAVLTGLPYTLLTLVTGWWGIPWGPIYTIQCLYTNLRGGKDVTATVLGTMVPAPRPVPIRPAR